MSAVRSHFPLALAACFASLWLPSTASPGNIQTCVAVQNAGCSDSTVGDEFTYVAGEEFAGSVQLCTEAFTLIGLGGPPSAVGPVSRVLAADSVAASSCDIFVDDLYAPQPVPDEFGTTYFEVATTGANESSSVTMTFRSRSSLTLGAEPLGQFTTFGMTGHAGMALAIQNTTGSQAEIHVDYIGSFDTTVVGTAGATVEISFDLFDGSGSSPGFLGSESGSYVQSILGPEGEGAYENATSCSGNSCGTSTNYPLYRGTVAASSTESVIAIVEIVHGGSIFNMSSYQSIADQTHRVVFSSPSAGVTFSSVPEPSTSLAALSAIAGLAFLRRPGRSRRR